jgi:ferredoxin
VKVTVDDQRCRGHGMCLTLCQVFGCRRRLRSADPEEVPAGLEDTAREAIENCPEQAISEID